MVVPGIGTASPADWRNSSGQWLRKLVEDCSAQLQVWTYHYQIETKTGPIIQKVAEEGQNLLNALDKLCTANDVCCLYVLASESHPNYGSDKEKAAVFHMPQPGRCDTETGKNGHRMNDTNKV